jgi:hypothetical protein
MMVTKGVIFFNFEEQLSNLIRNSMYCPYSNLMERERERERETDTATERVRLSLSYSSMHHQRI